MAKKKFLQKEGISDIISKAKEQERAGEGFIKERITVLPELEKLIFPLSDEEFQQLQDNIRAEGCRDPLVLWQQSEEEYVLVDGHNRYKICQLLGVEFKLTVKEFADIEAVKDWMINNQLGRRNVTEETRSWLRGLQYKREKKKQGWQVGGLSEEEQANEAAAQPKGAKAAKGEKRTVEKLAKQHNVSTSTIQRDEKFVEAVEKMTGDDLSLRKKILNKQVKVPKTQMISMAGEEEDDLRRVGEELAKGKDWNEASGYLLGTDVAPPAPEPSTEEVQTTRKQVVDSLDLAIKKKDRKAFDKALKQLEKLRGLLFG